MLELQSVSSLKRGQSFEWDLSTIAYSSWPKSEKQPKDYDAEFKQTIENLEAIDKNLEFILQPIEDENIQLALTRAFYSDNKISNIKEALHFQYYLPQGRVQVQQEMLRTFIWVAKGKDELETFEQEVSAHKFKVPWEENPKIGSIKLDNKPKELRLREALSLFSKYLVACEHEFYKQMLALKFDSIMHEYDFLLNDAKILGEKIDRKLTVPGTPKDLRYAFHALNGITDGIYYRRGRNFLSIISTFYNFLSKNEFTELYLLTMEDLFPKLKNAPSQPIEVETK